MADVVEKRLREYFKKNAFRPGDPIPKEMELAEALQVSRNVVREALSRLKMLGMIESKKKRGMILSEPDIFGGFERVLDPLILEQQTLKDLFELRLVLELGLADLIFLRKTDKDIQDLEKIVSKSTNINKTSFKVKNEIAFHGKLYEMTGNHTIMRFQTLLMPIFEYVVAEEEKQGAAYSISRITHIDLLEILKNGSAGQFKEAMRAHLSPHFERLI
ncbi:regulatory protein GntR [Sphingobacterium deserti]|uniref:Regulatory protein GntR n=2 Tax=Sphingobacterium deserti TaxID=1229276 RepID=A0A0B8T7X4_9SPHI|nr:regulatory protein GntR [Sphingobacterium deserti]